MKKIISLFLTISIVLSLAACGVSQGQDTDNPKNPDVILENPPSLTVISGETAIGALLGTYSWEKRNSDGTSTGTEVDSAHPLDCEDWLERFETTKGTATLYFTENPNSILSVQCWNEKYWGDATANSESVSVNGYEIELKQGGYIYEVKAEWNTENGYGGIAYYSFYVKTDN